MDIEVPSVGYYDNPLRRGSKDKNIGMNTNEPRDKKMVLLVASVSLVAIIGGVVCGYYVGKDYADDEAKQKQPIKPNLATVEELTSSGVEPVLAQMLVETREEVIVSDVMDLLDVEDSNTTRLYDNLASMDFDPLAGVNPNSDEFLNMATDVCEGAKMEDARAISCASTQLPRKICAS